MFVKMGLGGTGYLGKKESHTRAVRKCIARRRVLPGFPIEEPFRSIKDVRHYLAGESIICLLCGKNYKKLGHHLSRIHGVTVDEYKKRYNIPWTYGLCCRDTSERYRRAIERRMRDGYKPPAKDGRALRAMIKVERRECPFKSEVAVENLGDAGLPKRPLLVSPDGKPETLTERRERLRVKRGTSEFREKMVNRPQCQRDYLEETGFLNWWSGKKQSKEHVEKRMKR